jgi:hypothetical protein
VKVSGEKNSSGVATNRRPLTDEVQSQGPYAEKGQRDRRNSNTASYEAAGTSCCVALTESGQGYAATFDIALDTTYS